jgi:hypothetical protein
MDRIVILFRNVMLVAESGEVCASLISEAAD